MRPHPTTLEKRMERVGLPVVLALLSALLALLTQLGGQWTPVSATLGPQIAVSPTSGPGNTLVTVTGSGWEAVTPVDLLWDNPQFVLTTATPDGSGAFSVQVYIPAGAALGPHVITAMQNAVGGTGGTAGTGGTGGTGGTVPGGLLIATTTFTVTAGAPNYLSFTQQPSGGLAGEPWGIQPIVKVYDAHGNLVDTDNTTQVQLAILSGTGANGAQLTCTANPLTVVNGVAMFSGCEINLAGTDYVLVASAVGNPNVYLAYSIQFTVGGTVDRILAISPVTQVSNAGEAVDYDLVVVVQDDLGNPVPGVPVVFSTNRGSITGLSGSGTNLTETTDADGLAGVVLTMASAGAPPNTHTITATCGTCATTQQVTFAVSVASSLLLAPYSGFGQFALTNDPLKRRLRVVVVDATTGLPVPGIPLSFSITNTPAGATGQTLGDMVPAGGNPNSLDTGPDGQAAVRLTVGNLPGDYVVRVTCAACNAGFNLFDFVATALQRRTLSGFVTGASVNGTPLPVAQVQGALVSLTQPEYGLNFNTTAGADGGFSRDVAAGSVLLVAQKEGFYQAENYAVMYDDGTQNPAAANLILPLVQPGKLITGQVLRGGLPVQGAHVSAYQASAGSNALASGAGFVEDFTNSTGTYSLAVPEGTYWVVSASINGVGTAYVDLNPADGVADVISVGTTGASGQNIVFPTTVTLTGSVKVDGNFVASGKGNVTATPVGTAPPGGSANIDPTNAGNGAYSMALPVPGTNGAVFRYVLNATVDGVGDLTPRLVRVKNDNGTGVCVDASGANIACVANFNVFTRTITVNFRDDNTPAQPVTVDSAAITATASTTVGVTQPVTVAAPQNSITVANVSSASLKVVAIGEFSGTSSVTYTLQVTANGQTRTLTNAAGQAVSSVTVPESQTVTATIPIAKFTVSGIVQENTGGVTTASSGATVQISGGTVASSMVTGSTGAFSFTVPAVAANYQLTAAKAGFIAASTNVTVTGNLPGIGLTLVSAATQATISGVVAGPPAGVSVTVTAISSTGQTVSTTRGTTGPNCGASAVPTPTAYCLAVGNGTWTISATADGYVFASTNQPNNQVTIAGGVSVNNVNITMNPVQSDPPIVQQCTEIAGCRAEGSTQGGISVLLVVPPGAAGTTTNVITVIAKITTDAPTTGTFATAFYNASGIPAALDLRVLNSQGQLVTQFNSPLIFKLTAPFAGTVAGMGFYNFGTGNWVVLTHCTGTGNSRTCLTDHLTKFTVLSAKASGAITAAPTAGPGGGGGVPIAAPPGGVQTATGSFSVATGGSLTAGDVIVNVPSGVAGTSDVTITLAVNPAGTPLASGIMPPTGGVLGSKTFTITARDSSGRTITELSKPVTVMVPLTSVDLTLAGGNASEFSLWRYDETSKTWVEAGEARVSTDGRYLIVSVQHFSLYALIVKATPPSVIGPEDGALVIGLDPVLAWSQSPATRQFHVQIVPFNNDGPGLDMIIGQADLVALARYEVPPPQMGAGNYILLPGMTYTWRVRTSPSDRPLGVDAAGWSAFSPARTFKTGVPTSATIQPVFPFNGGTSVTTRTPRLQWTDQNDRIFYYEVQLSKDPMFETDPAKATAAVYWELVHGGQTDPLNSYQVKDAYRLEPNTTYYWRVRPRVQGDGTPVAWSDTWTFHTQ